MNPRKRSGIRYISFRHILAPAIILMFVVSTGRAAPDSIGSIRDTTIEWPTIDEVLRVVLLRDYNTRVVVIGTMLLGLAAGVIGTFILLRKRSLMGDAVSHATLPGIGLAFIIMSRFGGSGKHLPGLLAGAMITGLIGMGLILLIRNTTRLKEDAALGIVLSVFFGFGVAILGIIQKMSTGHAAGLESFIYGKTASMLAADAQLIAYVALLILIVCTILYKEFTLLCFDQEFASSQGWPVVLLDITMMVLVVIVTVIGLQAVGLILVIALLIIPAAAARFWSYNLLTIVIASGIIGAFSGLAGAGSSALIPRLPTGAIIVVIAASVFIFSLVFGSARGLLVRIYQHLRLLKKVGHQNLLRAMFEWWENHDTSGQSRIHRQSDTKGAELANSVCDRDSDNIGNVEHSSRDIRWGELLALRSWAPRRLRRLIRIAIKEELISQLSLGSYRLTEVGKAEAKRIVRNHRLWEIYLITHADIAPSRVDRDADQIEHVLGRAMVDKLERILASTSPDLAMPSSPHPL